MHAHRLSDWRHDHVFLGAWRDHEGMNPLLAGTLGGLLTTWVTFTPCFLWIFVGAPYV